MNTLINSLLMHFFIFETVICAWVKRFYNNIPLLFCPAWDNFSTILLITYFKSMFFFLIPGNFKAFQVFEGIDERNIGAKWIPRKGTKGLLSVCRNHLGWRRRDGVNLYLLITFLIFNFNNNFRTVFFVLLFLRA